MFNCFVFENFKLFNYQIQKTCLTPDKNSKVSTTSFSLRNGISIIVNKKTLHWNSSCTRPSFIKKTYETCLKCWLLLYIRK